MSERDFFVSHFVTLASRQSRTFFSAGTQVILPVSVDSMTAMPHLGYRTGNDSTVTERNDEHEKDTFSQTGENTGKG